MTTHDFSISTHEDYPHEECALVDRGLGEFNDAAAPLHEVQAISCFARSRSGKVVGGAVGRCWGTCCELQQLWVAPEHRRVGIGAMLMHAFEAQACGHGCTAFFLETFSFQASSLYLGLGYKVQYEQAAFPHGIVKVLMGKKLDGRTSAP